MPTTIAGAGLGRLFDFSMLASGQGINTRNCNAVAINVYSPGSSAVITLTVSKTFGGAYAQNGITPFTYYYSSTQANGTGQWIRNTQAASNVVTVSGSILQVSIPLYMTQLPDQFYYIKVTTTVDGSAVTQVLPHDLAVARAPANLAVLGA
jgi:hypothetical protein